MSLRYEIVPFFFYDGEGDAGMETDYGDIMYRVNCLAAELDAVYHRISQKLGVPDSVMMLLYALHRKGGRCPISDLRRDTNISKQTLNSAVRKLEGEGFLYLEQNRGRYKTLCLTQAGRSYAEQTAGRLLEAECSIFREWSQDEIEDYLRLCQKYNDGLRVQAELMKAM